jgi:hypothetical protein
MMMNVGPAHPLGIRDSRARTFLIAVTIALVAHLPLTPLPFVLRLLAMYLTRGDTSWDYQDDLVIIPISLVEDTPRLEEPAPPSEPQAAPAEAKPPKHEPDVHRQDAGPLEVSDGGTEGASREAGPVADAARERKIPREASVASGDAQGDGGGPGLKDTLSLVGGLKRAVQGKPNVALVFWFSTIRDHPLGPLVGTLLGCNAQWHDFVGDLIDPLKDLDGVMLTGPRLADTSKVTVIAQHRLEDSKVSEVMSLLGSTAKKNGTGGPIASGHAGMLAVRFHADRADRIAFTHPRNVIIVTPPEGFEQLRDEREPLSLPAGQGKAMSLTMVNPWRPLRAVGMHLPETLTEIRVHITAATDGGVNAEIEFDDQDAAMAKQHAPDISEQARAVGGPFLSDLEFLPHENHLRAHTHLSRIASTFALGFVRGSICPSGGFDGGAGLR